MEWVSTNAKSVPEAIDLALDNLGVDESEAEIVVVEEPRHGLFGRVRGSARVKARVKPLEGAKTRSNNRRKRSSSNGRDDRQGRSKNGGNRSESSSKNNRNSKSDRSSKSDRNGGGKKQGRGQGRSGQDGRKQGGRNQGRGGQNRQDRQDRSQSRRSNQSNGRSSNRTERDMPEAGVAEVTDHLETFLGGLSEAFGFDGAVRVDEVEENSVVAMVEGQHGLLVGPKGRTLEAIQELSRMSAQRTVPSSVRISIDVGGYRERRNEALASFALKAADRAIKDSTEVGLEPMSSADRKVVHNALIEVEGVETRSVGRDPRRYVLVVPLDVSDVSDESE